MSSKKNTADDFVEEFEQIKEEQDVENEAFDAECDDEGDAVEQDENFEAVEQDENFENLEQQDENFENFEQDVAEQYEDVQEDEVDSDSQPEEMPLHGDENYDDFSIDVDRLTIEELKLLYRTQTDLIDALVAENNSLLQKQEELTKKLKQESGYLEQLTHMKRDFDNYKRRQQNAHDMSKEQGKAEVLKKILPILDTFERAEKGLSGTKELEHFLMVSKQFEKILRDIGLEEVEVLGLDFDPNIACAVAQEPVDKEFRNKVVEVLSKGYKYNDKIVRYANVKVGC